MFITRKKFKKLIDGYTVTTIKSDAKLIIQVDVSGMDLAARAQFCHLLSEELTEKLGLPVNSFIINPHNGDQGKIKVIEIKE